MALCSYPPTLIVNWEQQFASDSLASVTGVLGSKRIRSITYRLASNGLIEQLDQTFKEALGFHEKPDCSKVHG